MNTMHLNAASYYQLDVAESRAWGAYEEEGHEADDGGAFRRELRAELREIADGTGRDIQVYADGRGLDCQDWCVETVFSDVARDGSDYDRADYDV